MVTCCKSSLLLAFAFIFVLLSDISDLLAVDISDSPLETLINTAPPNVVFILDDSGSMDMEFMTTESIGLFNGCYYLFPDSAYSPIHDHEYGAGHALSASQRRMWRSQWIGENRIYYAPHKTYHPWPATSKFAFGPAHMNRPWSNPSRTGPNCSRLKLSAGFFSVRCGTGVVHVSNAHYFTHYDANANDQLDSGENIYLVTWVDSDNDQLLDVSGELVRDQRQYYRFMDDGDGQVEDDELVLVTDNSEKNRIRSVWTNTQGQFERIKTDSEDLQNFANWFSYYRRRELAAKAVVAEAIAGMEQIYIGLYAVNSNLRMGVHPVKTGRGSNAGDGTSDQTEYLLNALYAMNSKGTTPLRSALDQVGRYFDKNSASNLGRSPFWGAGQGGGCQRACAIVITDGFWNGSFTGLGNVDGDNGRPYADSWGNTLADIAMHYFENDLAPDLPDRMPSTSCDHATYQHMNTYTLFFGVQNRFGINGFGIDGIPGNMGHSHDPCIGNGHPAYPDWPQPVSIQRQELSEDPNADSVAYDVWHAALNGRGRYINAVAPEALMSALPKNLTEMGESASAATIAMEGTGSVVFQTSYCTDNWSGDVLAYPLNLASGEVSTGDGQELWSAADQLDRTGGNENSRRIVTYGGRWRQPQGTPFRFSNLTSGQLVALGSDLVAGSPADENAADILEYIRGRSFSKFGSRQSKLGDIVHSAPVLFENTLFVGANDGMLHAFDIRTGHERFAYVPNLVYSNLQALSEENYADNHKFYVDATPYVGEVEVGLYKRDTYLVGGLGKGGQGYYCFLVGSRERPIIGDGFGDYQWTFNVDGFGPDTPESEISSMVKWEYPRPNSADDDMDNDNDGLMDETNEIDPCLGYSFSQAYVVNANAPDDIYRPVVIYGNGYNSVSQRAVLYVLTAEDGRVLRKIDTGKAVDNGLSTPALVDIDLDRRVDYAYAGDLNGNLWKFDLTSSNPSQWGLAYGEDLNGDGVINAADGDEPRPLFLASGQPITGRPDVMAMRNACAAQAPGFMVIFGTGKYLGDPDRSDNSQQSIYGIWDYGDDSDDSEHLGHITNRATGELSCGYALQRQEVVKQITREGIGYRELSDIELDYRIVEDTADEDGYSSNGDSGREGNPWYYAGWFIDFPLPPDPKADSGERVTGQVAIRGGKSIITSFVPDATPCGGGGTSWLYILDGCYGTTALNQMDEPWNPKQFQGKLNDDPVIFKDVDQPRLDQILISDHTGQIMKECFLGEDWGKVFWRQNND